MNKRFTWVRMLISCLYVAVATIFYVWGFTVPLLLLGIPWTTPLMALSGLILHATVDGEAVLSVGSMLGVMLNVGIYYYYYVSKNK
jgi:hypothetical protein